jgi:predicted dehydrogenase
MGGIEANCRLRCGFSSQLAGEIRLSRDCQLRNEYIIRGTRGWLAWTPNDAEHLRLGLAGSPQALDATVHRLQAAGSIPALGRRAHSFQESFMAQIANVIAAITGGEPLLMPGTEGIRSIRVIEDCYQHRTLMAMPWLGSVEARRAEHLNHVARSAHGDPSLDQSRRS